MLPSIIAQAVTLSAGIHAPDGHRLEFRMSSGQLVTGVQASASIAGWIVVRLPGGAHVDVNLDHVASAAIVAHYATSRDAA